MTAHTAVLLAKLPGPPGPTAARPRQAPALHGPPRGPVTPTEPRPGSGQFRQPERTAPRPSCRIRSSAHLGPATAGPRRAPVLHALSRGPVTRKEPHWPGVNHAAGPHLASPHGPDQPGQVPYPGKRYSTQSTARDPQPTPGLPLPGPAGHALHGLSRGPATRTRPGAGDAVPKLHATSSARAATLPSTRTPPLGLHRNHCCVRRLGYATLGRTHGPDDPAGRRAPGPQNRKPSRRATSHESGSCGRLNRNYYPEAGHCHYRTRARLPATQTEPRLATRTKKDSLLELQI